MKKAFILICTIMLISSLTTVFANSEHPEIFSNEAVEAMRNSEPVTVKTSHSITVPVSNLDFKITKNEFIGDDYYIEWTNVAGFTYTYTLSDVVNKKDVCKARTTTTNSITKYANEGYKVMYGPPFAYYIVESMKIGVEDTNNSVNTDAFTNNPEFFNEENRASNEALLDMLKMVK